MAHAFLRPFTLRETGFGPGSEPIARLAKWAALGIVMLAGAYFGFLFLFAGR